MIEPKRWFECHNRETKIDIEFLFSFPIVVAMPRAKLLMQSIIALLYCNDA